MEELKEMVRRKFSLTDGNEAGLLRLLNRVFPSSLFSPSYPDDEAIVQVTTNELMSSDNDGEGKRTMFSLSAARCIRRTLVLPAAAAEHAKEAIAIEIKRSMPRNGLGLTWQFEQISKTDNTMNFEVFITKVSEVEEIRKKADQRNFSLEKIIVEGRQNIVFWPPQQDLQIEVRKWIVAAYIATILLSTMTILALELRVREVISASEELMVQNSYLSTEISRLSSDAENQVIEDIHALVSKFKSGERIAAKLNDLSNSLEGEGWLSEFEFDSDRIRLAAFSDMDVPTIVERIRKLPWVKNAELTSPIIRDNFLNQSRFELTITEVAQ